jgi:hypothetical protein
MAEELRSAAGSVVMVAGCELSLFCAGYLPGATLEDRLEALTGAAPAFWHTFAGWAFPHRPDPREDVDLGSFGLVKVVAAPSADARAYVLEPKEAFLALAAAYGRTGRR